MSRPNIVVDLDGVCYDLIGMIARIARERYSVILSESYVGYDIAGFINEGDGDDADKVRAKAQIFKMVSGDCRFYWSLQPLPRAQQALARLAEDFRIVAVTTRPIAVKQATRKAMVRDFPMIDPKDVYHRLNRNKVKSVLEFNPWFVLEDNPTLVEEYLAARQRVFYVQAGYGRPVQVKRGKHRLYTVPDAATAVEEILRLTRRTAEVA